jgi:hypothetical protein
MALVKLYPSQTKILEGLTKEEIRISKEALFKGVSTRFGLRTIEKYIENLDFLSWQSFQNLRSGSINFKSLLIRNCIQQMMLFCNLFFHADCVVFKVLLRQLRECNATKKHGGD